MPGCYSLQQYLFASNTILAFVPPSKNILHLFPKQISSAGVLAVLYAFGRLPKRQQAVFFAGVGFAWNVILSLITNPIARRHGEALQRRLSQPHEAGSSR